MRATTRRYLGRALPSVGLVLVVLVAVAAFGLSYSVRAAAHTEAASEAPQAVLPERPAAQGCTGHPLVDGLFYGIGTDGCRDADRYSKLAETPGESVLWYYIDGDMLYAALVVNYDYNDNVFGWTKDNKLDHDMLYLQSAGWTGASNSKTFKMVYESDHSVWSLFCGGGAWTWQQDLLWDTDGDRNLTEADWQSDPYGTDGTPPPAAWQSSASSIQWNMNFYANNPTLGWDVSLGGARTNWDVYKSYSYYGAADTDVTDALDGWLNYPYVKSNASGQTIWEWHVVYESVVDISVCGANPFTLWPVTGHNSPPKGGLSNSTSAYEWGDLPDTYQTVSATNGARHLIVSTPLYMGNVLEPDTDGQPSVDALGDDLNPAGLADDEDGVFVADLAAITAGQPVSIRVIATNLFTSTTYPTGVTAYLYGFIDFNGDGDFADANEVAYVTVPYGTSEQVLTINFGNAPATLAPTIYSRFRLSTSQAAASITTGLAPNGEVEDYVNYPTWALLEGVNAYNDRGQVVLEWTTAAEIGTLGFDLLRLDPRSDQFVPVNEDLLPGVLSSRQGGTYRFVDDQAVPGKTYTYKIIEVGLDGSRSEHGPFTVRAAGSGPLMKERFSAQKRETSPQAQARSDARAAELAQVPEASAQATSSQVKIAVREAGLYKVDAAQVASLLGRSASAIKSLIKTGQLQLSNQGQSVAYTPAPDNSALYFYGEAVDSIYTDQNVYWLKMGSGLLMKAQGGKGPQPAAGALTFVDTMHAEKDVEALVGLQLDPQSDYWAWTLLAAPWISNASYEVRSDGAAGTGTASLRVRMFGASDQVSGLDHHTRVNVNGHFAGESWWDGSYAHEFVVDFDAAWLNSGANTIEVREVADAGVPSSIVYVDSLDLTYSRLYRAVNNRLLLRGDGNAVVTVSGLTSNDILVLDLSSPKQPRLVGARTVSGSAGNYQVSFAPASASTNYLVAARNATLAPARVWGEKESALTAKHNRANYVVIAPAEFKAGSQALAAYRQSKGYKTLVVDVEDIYDEFNYGLRSPEAIRSFLTNAYNTWQQKPAYVVLAGEGSFDYKDNKGYHDSVIPTLMVLTPYGLDPSDTSLGDVVGDDGLPEVAIGRLPALTSLELGTLVAKIQTYEASSGGWTSRALMLADNPDKAGNFHVDSEEMIGLLPVAYTPVRQYQGSALYPASKQAIIDGINGGVGWFNYIGHGSPGQLMDEALLTNADVAGLNNATALPVMTAMTCLVGDYGTPGVDSLSESLLLRAGGGTVANWAPTGLSVNPLSMMLDEGFFQATFQSGQKVLGDAIRSAQSSYVGGGGARYTLETYNLLGDPALRVK